jgi:hypothetical protein
MRAGGRACRFAALKRETEASWVLGVGVLTGIPSVGFHTAPGAGAGGAKLAGRRAGFRCLRRHARASAPVRCGRRQTTRSSIGLRSWQKVAFPVEVVLLGMIRMNFLMYIGI